MSNRAPPSEARSRLGQDAAQEVSDESLDCFLILRDVPPSTFLGFGVVNEAFGWSISWVKDDAPLLCPIQEICGGNQFHLSTASMRIDPFLHF
jgi:hypothetical protein